MVSYSNNPFVRINEWAHSPPKCFCTLFNPWNHETSLKHFTCIRQCTGFNWKALSPELISANVGLAYKWNICTSNLFFQVWKKSIALPSLIQARIRKYSHIVNSTRPPDVNINESTMTIHCSLQDDRMPSFRLQGILAPTYFLLVGVDGKRLYAVDELWEDGPHHKHLHRLRGEHLKR